MEMEKRPPSLRDPAGPLASLLALVVFGVIVVALIWAALFYADLEQETLDLAGDTSVAADQAPAGTGGSGSAEEPDIAVDPTAEPTGEPFGEPTADPTADPVPFSEDLIALARNATWADGDGEEVTVGDRSDPQGYVGFEEGIEAEGGETVNALVTRPAPDGTLVGTVMLTEPIPQGARLHGQVGFGRVEAGLEAFFTMSALFPDDSGPAEIASFVSDTFDKELREPFDYDLSNVEGATTIVLQVSGLTVDAADPLWIDLTVDGLR
jgi:hypothetical protein